MTPPHHLRFHVYRLLFAQYTDLACSDAMMERLPAVVVANVLKHVRAAQKSLCAVHASSVWQSASHNFLLTHMICMTQALQCWKREHLWLGHKQVHHPMHVGSTYHMMG